MRAVADTEPLHYPILIRATDIHPKLVDTVMVPEPVLTELSHARTPPPVRGWMTHRPAWLQLASVPPVGSLPLPMLGDGERAVLALALSVRADLLFMDDRAGVAAARRQGF